MCVFKAVADVFVYQQTAVLFKAGAPTADGKGQPFCITQLADVIRQLRATPELIMMAFSQGLDHSIGTSYSGFSVMTALCEHLELHVGNWLKKPFVSEPDVSTYVEPVSAEGYCWSGGSVAEADRAEHTRHMHASRVDQMHNLVQMSNLVTLDGMSKDERDDVLKSLERSRRSTAAYRLLCSQNGNSDVVMSNPIDTIERVMRGAVHPPDACEAIVSDPADYLPFYSSSIMANVLQVNMLYTADNMATWCSNMPVTHNVDNLSLGTSYGLNFSESHSGGPSQYNYAWLVAKGSNGHRGVAYDMINRNRTVANFDIGFNMLRDTLYLLSTSDNTRRCTEKPALNPIIHESQAFTDENQSAFESPFGLSSNEVKGGIRIRSVMDCRNREAGVQLPGSQTKPRHPYSKVTDSGFQRKIDLLIQGGRFPATLASVSNKVSKCAPVRVVSRGENQVLEANTASCIDHTRTLAEAILRGSLQPGMQGMQETLCGNSSAPAGLCADSSSANAATDNDERCHTLPYSIDIVGISICLDVAARPYDPDAESNCTELNAFFLPVHDFRFDVDKLPHTSLRYVGLESSNGARKLLSVPIRTAPNPAFNEVMVDDVGEEEARIAEILPNLHLSLGHAPDDEEIQAFLTACTGSRAMPGTTGDIMSMRTYRDFTMTSMSHRGFLDTECGDSGCADPVAVMIQDEGLGMRLRFIEKASEKINEIIDKHVDFHNAHLPVAGDAVLGHVDRSKAVADRIKETRYARSNPVVMYMHCWYIRTRTRTRVCAYSACCSIRVLSRALSGNVPFMSAECASSAPSTYPDTCKGCVAVATFASSAPPSSPTTTRPSKSPTTSAK